MTVKFDRGRTWTSFRPRSTSDPTTKRVSHYEIPDMHREDWIETKPNLHTRQINDARLRSEDFKVIKMIKWWRSPAGPGDRSTSKIIALSATTSSGDIPWAVFQWFQRASEAVGATYGTRGFADDYLDWRQREKLATWARPRAQPGARGLRPPARTTTRTAITLWKSIFGQRFGMDELLGLSRAELDEAKRLLRFRLLLEVPDTRARRRRPVREGAGRLLVALAVLRPGRRPGGCARRRQPEAGRGNEGMLVMPIKHLGSTAERLQTTDLLKRFSKRQAAAPSSKILLLEHQRRAGGGAPAANGLETAMQTEHLYEAAATRSLIFCGVITAAALIPLLVIVFARPGDVGLTVAQIAVILLAPCRLRPARAGAQ